MAELVADYVLERLTQWGVNRIYGYPGDGIASSCPIGPDMPPLGQISSAVRLASSSLSA